MRKLDEKMDSLALLSSSSRDPLISRNSSSVDSAGSSRSLASIASSLSRLEAILSPGKMSPPWEATENDSQNYGAEGFWSETLIRLGDRSDSNSSLASLIESHDDSPASHNEYPTSAYLRFCSCCPNKPLSFHTDEALRLECLEFITERPATDKILLL